MRTGLKRAAVTLATALMMVVACTNDVESKGQPNAAGPKDIATNLDVPWGIAFLANGSALIAERNSGAIKQMSAPGVVNQVGVGKILRINPDGSIPSDNPDPASPVWSFGHRNIQGLAWDGSGRLWATEYGANRFDELNLIQPGGNYGWPMAEGRADTPGLVDPAIQWGTDEASPSGLAYYGGSLWVAALRGQRLFQVPVGADGSVGNPAALFVGQYGRRRTIVAAPDGTLWFTTSNRDGRGSPRDGDDRILQFRP